MSVYLVLAAAIALWALLIYVIVVEPVRLWLRGRQAKAKPVPMTPFRVLSRS